MRYLPVTFAALFAAASAAALPSTEPEEALGLSTDSAGITTDVERMLSELDRRERAIKRRQNDIVGQLSKGRASIIARGRAYVRGARTGLLPVGGGFEALADHATRLERLRRALTRDIELEQRLVAERMELGKKLDALRVQRGPLEAQQRAIAQSQAALLAARDRQLSFQQAFLGGRSGTAVYGAGVGPADPGQASHGFSALKGKLPFPIPGRTLIRSARRSGDGPGLEMRAPRGTPVRAVFAGRVGFADEYADYGRTVILDHGAGHYTVSASLADISVAVGDEVDTGSRIGSVGDMGGGPLLYFEIRVGTDTVDPAEWFGI
jgi:septal ring factor EnvC (AmiA/AmiB activator)